MEPKISLAVCSCLSPMIQGALSQPNLIRASSKDEAEIQKAITTINQQQKPSALAGIIGPLYASVKLIDDTFIDAIENYTQNLVDASTKDLIQPLSLIAYPIIYAGAVGAANIALKYTPNISIIREICQPILLVFGFFWGSWNKEKIIKEKMQEDKSSNRIKWANHVSIEEENRMEEGVKLLKIRVQVLQANIIDADNNGLRDQDAIDELNQIAAVVRITTQQELLMKNQEKISQFLARFQ